MQGWRVVGMNRTHTTTSRCVSVTVPLGGWAVNPGTGETLNEYVPGARSEKTIARPDEHSVTLSVTHQVVPHGRPLSRNMIESWTGTVVRANVTWTVTPAPSIVTGDGGTDAVTSQPLGGVIV